MSFQISNTCLNAALNPAPVKSNTEKLCIELQNQLNSTNKVSELLSQDLNVLNQGIEKTQNVLGETNNKFICLNQSNVATKQSLDSTRQSLTATNEKLIIVNHGLAALGSRIEDLKESNSELIAILQADDEDAAKLRASIGDEARSLAIMEIQIRNMTKVMNKLIILQQQNL